VDSDHDGLSDDAEVRRYGTDPRKRDSDGDGLGDGDEIHRYHTNPRRSDGDHDGLTDGAEARRYRTDPRKRDTDGDRLSDGDEIHRYHTNPLKRDSDGDGYGDRAEVLQGTDPRAPRSRPGFPAADNTGVPAGTTLTPYTGPDTITTPNTVIDGQDINTCLTIRTTGVVIRNSKITCTAATGFYGILVYDGTSDNVALYDTEITCGGSENTALAQSNISGYRLNIHNCANGASVTQNSMLQDSYLHDWTCCTDNHPDGIQFNCCAASNITLRHNTITGQNNDGSPGNSSIIMNNSGDTNILIEKNLFYGGGWTVYCSVSATNERLTANHFSRKLYPKVGNYGPSVQCSDKIQSGNVYHETGQALNLR